MAQKIYPIKLPFTLQINEQVSVERFTFSYIVVGEQLAVVDTGVAASHQMIVDGLAELGKSLDDVDWVINTHAHPDHAGGNVLFQEKVAPKFAAHAKAARWIENMELQAKERPLYKFETLVGGPVEVTRKLEDGDEIDLGGDTTLQVVFVPGHAPGLMSLYCPQEGSLLCADSIPPTQGLPLYYDVELSRQSLKKLAGVKDVKTMYHSHVDEPYTGDGVATAIQDGLDFIDKLDMLVSEAVESLPADAVPEDITRETLLKLGFEKPPVLPLTVATVMAHVGQQ